MKDRMSRLNTCPGTSTGSRRIGRHERRRHHVDACVQLLEDLVAAQVLAVVSLYDR